MLAKEIFRTRFVLIRVAIWSGELDSSVFHIVVIRCEVLAPADRCT